MSEPPRPPCAVGPCLAPRAPGSAYCEGHGPQDVRRSGSGRQALAALLIVAAAIGGAYWFSQHNDSSGGSAVGYTPPTTDPGPAVPVDPGPTVHTVIYQLGGTARSADVTLKAGEHDSQQRHVPIPITNKSGSSGLRFNVVDGDFLYFSAQNNGSGTISCTIREDGTVVAHNTSRGQYAIATCDGEA